MVYSSYGRGGAGNMARANAFNESVFQEPTVLPTLHTPYVTTGRGGCGNMFRNTDPAETRMRQGVVEYVRPTDFPEAMYAHGGRGGFGNIQKMTNLSHDDHSTKSRTPSLDSTHSMQPRRRSTEIVNRAINFFRK